MGMSSSKTTTNSGPSKFAQPYISSAADAASGVYNQQKGNVADISGQIQSLIPGLMEKYKAGNPSVNAAQGYNSDVLGGKYLEGNPYLESIIGKTAGDVTDRVNGAIGSRGVTGGSSHASVLTKQLADAENTLRYNDYGAQMSRMDTAAGQAPGLAAADYLGISPLLAAAQSGTELPFSAANNYGDLIARLLGNSTTTTQKSSGSVMNMLAQMAGNAASAYAGGA